MKMIPIEFFLLLSAILFAIGLVGLLIKSNGIVILMCIELMLNAANMNFIAFASGIGEPLAEVFVIMSISVAAAEVGVGIAVLLHAYKVRKTTSVDDMTIRWGEVGIRDHIGLCLAYTVDTAARVRSGRILR
ncbi:MAG: NADH-quinone oxidoreductase subunit NuoK [Methanomassiliicoccaceae archaeon]|nr:NADH-quinone oxidoreductase subunit NuoK [Methanomassiliicoccaceae archaeon]